MKTYGIPGRVFEYQGKKVTVAELSRMSGVPAATIHNRLNYGWSIEAAISAPHKQGGSVRMPLLPEFENGNIVEVVFRQPVGVYSHMRPKLNKRYIVTAHTSLHNASPTYTITLENGKLLIVYPDEFEIVRVMQRKDNVLLAAE